MRLRTNQGPVSPRRGEPARPPRSRERAPPCAAAPLARRFARDARGVAAVEAAILLPVFLFLMVVCVDFAFAFQARVKLAGALSVGSQYAAQAGASVTAAEGAAFAGRIAAAVTQNVGRIGELDVRVRFNGSADASSFANFYCVSGRELRRTGTTPQPCGDATVSGRFVTIEATGSLPTLFPLNPIYGNRIVLQDASTARVE